MTSLLDVATGTLDEAQIELAEAEIAAIEATARAADARESVARLVVAVAALNGETPVEPPSEVPSLGTDVPKEGREAAAVLSPEEFDAERKRKQRKRQKELDAQNPLAQYPCAGCGAVGRSTEQLLSTPSGAQVRIIGCGACGNQTFL